jgi:hypothetical protein
MLNLDVVVVTSSREPNEKSASNVVDRFGVKQNRNLNVGSGFSFRGR